MSPDEINARYPEPVYRCRNCRAATGLRWFGDTSCPVCSRPECYDAVSAEYQAAYQSLVDESDQINRG